MQNPEKKKPAFALTAVAAQAFGFADLFNLTFKAGILGGGMPSKIELTTPHGPSTAGGKLALQHIRLVPAQGPATVIGSVDGTAKQVQLRSYDLLKSNHRTRFAGQDFPLDYRVYEDLYRRLVNFFEMQKFQVSRQDVDDDMPPPAPPPAAVPPTSASGPSKVLVFALVGVGILVGVGATIFLMK